MERNQLKALVIATGCAEEHGSFVFLCDPQWSPGDRAQAEGFFALARTGAVESGVGPEAGLGWLCVPTGGTSGGVRFARHDEQTLSAAVEGFCAQFGLERVNAVDVLPPYHVSGLMARVRCAATGGRHLAWSGKLLVAGERPTMLAEGEGEGDGEKRVISLVPTQVQRLLAAGPETVAWLRGFAVIFVGGGPIWPELAEAAAQAGLPLALTYGMTETAAMVAALPPAEFLAGERNCGRALPHARIELGVEGDVRVVSEAVFRGYFPHWRGLREFTTDDLGEWDARGRLVLAGRRDAVIISGGKKVHSEEVEAVLRGTGEFSDVGVVGVPDAEWGEAVVACYPRAEGREPDLVRVRTALSGLASAKRPKMFLALTDWPRTAQGKLNRRLLAAMAAKRR